VILYLDTSSLVKLYVNETHSDEVHSIVEAADLIGTSLVAYVEAKAAFARRFREGAYASRDYRRLLSTFDMDWTHYLVLQVTLELVRWAGDRAEHYGLRGFDAIHLASAATMAARFSQEIVFSCFDRHLQDASVREGFTPHPPYS